MDPFRNPPADSLAAARLHVQALTDCGLPREALLRALLENYEANESRSILRILCYVTENELSVKANKVNPSSTDTPDTSMGMETGFPPNHQQLVQHGKMGTSHGSSHTRLSVSTTSSKSSGRASILSTATSMSSVSSQLGGQVQDLSLSRPPSSTAVPPPTTTKHTIGTIGTNNRGTSKPQGSFWCTFCDVAFQRKFDWKRHEDEFHERYKRYPCPNCNRIFWGANTFNQHHKNAHGCQTCPHADRVVKYTQRKHAWACGFCGAFLGSRDRYFDHVARHYEDGCNKSHWNHSLVIYGLLHQPSIIQAWKELDAELYGHLPRGQQPVLEWDPEATGHAQGFLEGESPGKLQDLLEFFNETRDNPTFLARLAHDSAIIRARQNIPATGATTIDPLRTSMDSISTPPAYKMKHSATLQHAAAVIQVNNSFGQIDHQQYRESKNGAKRQRSIAPAPSTFSTPHHHQHQHSTTSMQQQPQTQYQQHQQHSQLASPSGPFAHTIAELEAAEHHDFNFQAMSPTPSSHHDSLAVPPLVIPSNGGMFEDWSSLTTTVVDEAAFGVAAQGWNSGGHHHASTQ